MGIIRLIAGWAWRVVRYVALGLISLIVALSIPMLVMLAVALAAMR